MPNQINIIKPYRIDGVWLFDDERVGLNKEPFVGGTDTIIEVGIAREGIANAADGFLMLFSADPFPGADMQLEWVREEFGGNVYRWEQREGWLCPALLRYFDAAPQHIFVQLKEASA